MYEDYGSVTPSSGEYPVGTVIQLTASATNNDNLFDHWEVHNETIDTENPITITMDRSKTVMAVFTDIWPPPPWLRHLCCSFSWLIILAVCLAFGFLGRSKQA